MNELEQVKRGPGRPPNVRPEVIEQAATIETETPRVRPVRKPFGGVELKMAYPQREGYHRHWFNDVPGRVQRAQDAGYVQVTGNDGKPVSMVVGTAEGGGPLTAFLMEIPQEWYQKDMAAQQKEIDDKENLMRRGELVNQADGKSYIPAQGISIKHGS